MAQQHSQCCSDSKGMGWENLPQHNSHAAGVPTATARQTRGAYFPPACCCIICCIWLSASLDSSPKRSATRAECFMNLVQHDCTHCSGREGAGASGGAGQRRQAQRRRAR